MRWFASMGVELKREETGNVEKQRHERPTWIEPKGVSVLGKLAIGLKNVTTEGPQDHAS